MQISTIFKRLIVIGGPLLLGIVEIWHEVPLPFDGEGDLGPFTQYRLLAQVVDQWILIHVVQVPLFAIVAFGIILMVKGLNGFIPVIARVGMFVFIVFYTVMDAVNGIAVGILVKDAKELSPSARIIVEQSIESLWNSSVVGGFSVIGALGWVIGVFAAAVSLRRAGAPRFPVAMIILAAFLFGFSHSNPFGPIGMLLLSSSFLWLECFHKGVLNK